MKVAKGANILAPGAAELARSDDSICAVDYCDDERLELFLVYMEQHVDFHLL